MVPENIFRLSVLAVVEKFRDFEDEDIHFFGGKKLENGFEKSKNLNKLKIFV